jgi:hypothetical protein
MSYIEVLDAEIKASGEEPAFSGPIGEQAIAEFERALGVTFPESYRLFLRKFGALSFAGDTYYGITKSGLAATAVPSVLFATNVARDQGDADNGMVVIKASGYGPIYSIDTAYVGSSGEPVVVETALSFKRDGAKTVLYQSFGEFLCANVRQAIAEL